MKRKEEEEEEGRKAAAAAASEAVWEEARTREEEEDYFNQEDLFSELEEALRSHCCSGRSGLTTLQGENYFVLLNYQYF